MCNISKMVYMRSLFNVKWSLFFWEANRILWLADLSLTRGEPQVCTNSSVTKDREDWDFMKPIMSGCSFFFFFFKHLFSKAFCSFYKHTTTQPQGTYRSKVTNKKKKKYSRLTIESSSGVQPMVQLTDLNQHLMYIIAYDIYHTYIHPFITAIHIQKMSS